MVSLTSCYVICFAIVLQCMLIPTLAGVILQRPVYVNMNVYSRPNGKGMVQHIRHTIMEDHQPSSCFNLQSRHIGSVDLNDPSIKLTFYRSKDCLGAPIHSIKSICPHSTIKLMMKAKSVSIKKMKLVSVE